MSSTFLLLINKLYGTIYSSHFLFKYLSATVEKIRIFSELIVNNMVGGVSVKKNELTDKHYAKGSKGFYAALGISAVMIGAACLFAHKQGDRITDIKPAEDKTIVREAAVDRRITNIPKTTAPAYRVTTAIATMPVFTDAPEVTIPAAEISVDAAPITEPVQAEAEETAAQEMTDVKFPVADISNIISPFSGGELVKNETTGSWQTHNGVDIAAEVGAEVYAVAGGEITAVKNDALWGVTLLLDHKNGYTTRYCGLSADLAVQEGDKLSGGDIIGTVGGSADIESALAPHIHIEMTHNGKYIDPMSLISQ